MEHTDDAPERTTDTPRRFAIAIHGGLSDSGDKDKDFEDVAKVTLTDIIDLALKRLMDGEPALQVAEAAVAALEDATVFNPGKGSAAFNAMPEYEVSGLFFKFVSPDLYSTISCTQLEAAIMDGSTTRIGAVAAMRSTRNPVKAARRVLESGQHAFIVGPAADEFAKNCGLEQVLPNSRTQTYISLPSEDPDFGTVGAVVLDIYGNLAAAASSTGGIHGKDSDRIGDTANPGAGIWADHSSAIIW